MNYRLPRNGTRAKALFDTVCLYPFGTTWSDLKDAYDGASPAYNYHSYGPRYHSGMNVSRLIRKYCNSTGPTGKRVYTLKPEWAKAVLADSYYTLSPDIDKGKLKRAADVIDGEKYAGAFCTDDDGYPTTTLLSVPEHRNNMGSPEIRDLPWRSAGVVEADKNVQRIIELEDNLTELDLKYSTLKSKIKEWRDAASHAVVLSQQLDLVTLKYFSEYVESLQAHLAGLEQDIEDNL